MGLHTKDLLQASGWLSDAERVAVIRIIEACFTDIDPHTYLKKYFYAEGALRRRLRLYFSGADIVGYCLLVFEDNQGVTLIRASAGFLPEYRKGGNTFQFSLVESVKYWISRPWRKTYYADTMLSPAMYRAIAKHTGIVWPHPECQGPDGIFEQFNTAGHVSEHTGQRCLIRVDRSSNYSDAELRSFSLSNTPDIRYYCTLNPDFNRGVALFVIIPVNARQLFSTLKKAWRKS